jgi:hypothetical protein
MEVASVFPFAMALIIVVTVAATWFVTSRT